MPHNRIGEEQTAGAGFRERNEVEARRVGDAEPLQHSLDDPEMDLTDDGRVATGRVQQRTAAQRDASARARGAGVVVGREAEAGQRLEHGLPRIAACVAAVVQEFASPLDACGARVALGLGAGASQLPGQRGRQTGVVPHRHRGVGGRHPIQRGRASTSSRPGGGSFDEPKGDDGIEMLANGVGVQAKSPGDVSDPDGGVCPHVVEHPQPLAGQRHGCLQHRRRPGAQDDRLFFHGIYCSKLLGVAHCNEPSATIGLDGKEPNMPANDVIVASTAADAGAVEAITNHHAQLAGQLAVLTDAMVTAVERGADFEPTRAAALAFLAGELLPHAAAEEDRLYPAATRTQRARPLIESMIAAHRIIGSLVDGIRTEPPVRAAGSAQALRVLFDAHLVDENERILPIVAADPEVSLVEVTEGMHELLGHTHAVNGAEPSHNCGCGETDSDDPVLDVREVPHSIRHATVFGAFDAVPAGGALVLVAPHDPIPLLRQLDHRVSGRLEIRYEQRGPEAWRLRLIKR